MVVVIDCIELFFLESISVSLCSLSLLSSTSVLSMSGIYVLLLLI